LTQVLATGNVARRASTLQAKQRLQAAFKARPILIALAIECLRSGVGLAKERKLFIGIVTSGVLVV
jgi:hypothetical protein